MKNTKTVYIYKGTYGRYQRHAIYVERTDSQIVEFYKNGNINEYSLLDLCHSLQEQGYSIIFDKPDFE